MQIETSFDKFNSFVKDHVLYSSIPYIQAMPYGFKINGFMLKKNKGIWGLFDKSHQHRFDFFSKKIAILAAIMLIKNNNAEYTQLKNIDRSLDIFNNDLIHYSFLQKKNPENYVYKSRLDRIDQGIDFLKIHLSQIEKSVSLQ
jgi:hypothetical protein